MSKSSEIERIEKLNTEIGADKPNGKEICKHKGWEWEKHGRCCFNCGTYVIDFGD